MTPHPQQYIVDSDYIGKLDEWLGEHDITDFQRMQIRARLKLDPIGENHCDKCDHWDICDGCPYTDERSSAQRKQQPSVIQDEDGYIEIRPPSSEQEPKEPIWTFTQSELSKLLSENISNSRNKVLDEVLDKLLALASQSSPQQSRFVWVPVIEIAIAELRSKQGEQEQF